MSQLEDAGYKIEENVQEDTATGTILSKGTTTLSVAYSDGTVNLLISNATLD